RAAISRSALFPLGPPHVRGGETEAEGRAEPHGLIAGRSLVADASGLRFDPLDQVDELEKLELRRPLADQANEGVGRSPGFGCHEIPLQNRLLTEARRPA